MLGDAATTPQRSASHVYLDDGAAANSSDAFENDVGLTMRARRQAHKPQCTPTTEGVFVRSNVAWFCRLQIMQ